jgi:hypothetical protein
MLKQGLLHPGWCFPPECVVLDASHAESGTYIGTDQAAKSNLSHGHIRLALLFFYRLDAKMPDFLYPVAKFLVPDWGDIVHSATGLSFHPASLCSLAGQYDNPRPESTIYPPSQGLRIGLSNLHSPCQV